MWASTTCRIVGAALVVAGLGITLWSARLFTRLGTNIKTFDDPDVLVAQGPFRYSRNPMYAGFLLALIGIAITLGSLSTLVPAIAFYLLTEFWYIRFEEVRMAKKFGDDYAAYKRRVRRWF